MPRNSIRTVLFASNLVSGNVRNNISRSEWHVAYKPVFAANKGVSAPSCRAYKGVRCHLIVVTQLSRRLLPCHGIVALRCHPLVLIPAERQIGISRTNYTRSPERHVFAVLAAKHSPSRLVDRCHSIVERIGPTPSDTRSRVDLDRCRCIVAMTLQIHAPTHL